MFSDVPVSWSEDMTVFEESFGLELNRLEKEILTEFPISEKLFFILYPPRMSLLDGEKTAIE